MGTENIAKIIDVHTSMIGRRIGAFFIDGFLFLLYIGFLNPFVLDFFLPQATLEFSDLSTINTVLLATFLVYFILIEAVFLTSPGKWLLKLKITNQYPASYIRLRVFIRNIVKCLTIVSVIGLLITLVIFIVSQSVWYDYTLNLEVVEKEQE